MEGSYRHYFMLKTAAVTPSPLLGFYTEHQCPWARTSGPACSAIHPYNRHTKKGRPPCSPSWSCISLVKDSHPLQNFISLAFTGEQEMWGGQLIPFQGCNKLHLSWDKRFNPRWNWILLKLLLSSQSTCLLPQNTNLLIIILPSLTSTHNISNISHYCMSTYQFH